MLKKTHAPCRKKHKESPNAFGVTTTNLTGNSWLILFMSNDDQLEVAGHVWDSLSTGKKIGLGIMLTGAIAGAFWCGHQIAEMRHTNEIAAFKAEHAQQLAAQAKPSSQWGIDLVPPDAHLPTYHDAEPSDLSMAEIYAERERQREANELLTSVHHKPLLEEYVGKRFKWSGSVVDVARSMYSSIPYPTVVFKSKPELRWSCRAYFVGPEHEEMANALVPMQNVTISGVLNDRGDLTQCRFVRFGDPPEN